ncbi:MAG: aminotransferase class I/II-fold pyridoxal phosphate-dependent enzyme, partial [Pseudomonadota bacterium]|nr:aminotransferase class I/II-fold pyridoxal phosphate-dependent enzyme [Pseudomonadota bacterium]
NSRIPFLENDSHIIPIHLYDPDLCKEAANVLIEEHGVYIQPIFYPTVPKGDERFRVTITPKHSAEDVQTFVNSLDKVWSKLNLKRAKKTSSRVSNISNLF